MHETWHILSTLLRWPDGIILGNLLASLVWAIPGFIHLDRLAKRHHAERMQQARETHRLVKQLHEGTR